MPELRHYLNRVARDKRDVSENVRFGDKLLMILEFGGVTHPHFANLIAYALGMSAEERDRMVCEARRGKWRPGPAQKPSPVERLIEEDKRRVVVEVPSRPTLYDVRHVKGAAHEVVKIDRDGRVLQRYPSVKAAATCAGYDITTVQKRCNHRIAREYEKTGGVTWRYAEEVGADGCCTVPR